MAKIGSEFASNIAREYIEINLGVITGEEIISNLRRKTSLSHNTIKNIFNEVIKEKYDEAKRKLKERMKKEEIKVGDDYYKGRRRDFFMIDDSKLYRGVM